MPEMTAPPAGVAPAAPAPSPAPAARQPGSGAPTSNAKPSGAAVTQAKAVSKPADNMADAFAQLDRMGADPVDEPQDQADPNTDQNVDPNADNQLDPNVDPNTEPADGTQPEPQPKAKTLRQNLDFHKAELAKANAKIKELETARATPVDDTEKKKLTETLKQREARLAELDEEIRYSNFERSQEYKDKYETPYVDAYKEGRGWTTQLQISERKNEMDEVIRPGRQATEADFDAVMAEFVRNPARGSQMIADLFGDQATGVMYHAQETLKLNNQRLKALDTQRKAGAERDKTRQETATKQRDEQTKVFHNEADEARKKYKWFQPQEGDNEGNHLLEQGDRLAKLAFGLEVKDDNGNAVKLAPKEMARLHAAMYNKAAAFDRQVYLLRKANAEIKKYQKQLADFEKSVPGGGNGRQPNGKPNMSAWDTADAALSRLAR